jgi:hypothetical protein
LTDGVLKLFESRKVALRGWILNAAIVF